MVRRGLAVVMAGSAAWLSPTRLPDCSRGATRSGKERPPDAEPHPSAAACLIDLVSISEESVRSREGRRTLPFSAAVTEMRTLWLCCWSFLLIWALFGVPLLQAARLPRNKRASECQRDETLLVYRVILTGLWTREDFPKQFPDWRPKAHFSKLVGRSHNEEFKLFRLNERVSEGVKIFSETGGTEVLNEMSQGDGGVLDSFEGQAILQGVGQSETQFFVDGNHSRVSLMSRLVPSPDWFVGLDSLDLCSDGTWVNSVTIDGYPLDAGTDNGLTFTAPNWKTEPSNPVTRLTSRMPNHPASSFFYSDREHLPPIASFQILKVKEYELSQVFNHPSLMYETDLSSNDVLETKIRIRPLSTQLKQAGAPSNLVNYLSHLEKKNIHKSKKRKLKRLRGPGHNCEGCSRLRHQQQSSLFNWGAS